ncbi:MAG: PhzF family phenazine biosynthesis protein [Chthoniobacter sp.]
MPLPTVSSAAIPAGVCPLAAWLPDEILQRIAAENNLSETAFFVGGRGNYALRWFTPTVEVDLCGHATLAAAYVIFHELGYGGETIRFQTRIGLLGAARDGDVITLDFPAWTAKRCTEVPAAMADALGWLPRELFKTRDYLAVFSREDEILSLRPDAAMLAKLDCLGVICTAPGTDCDFVSRFFRARRGRAGRPGHRLGAQHAHPLLECTAREENPLCAPAFAAGRRTLLRRSRRTRRHRRKCRPLQPRAVGSAVGQDEAGSDIGCEHQWCAPSQPRATPWVIGHRRHEP